MGLPNCFKSEDVAKILVCVLVDGVEGANKTSEIVPVLLKMTVCVGLPDCLKSEDEAKIASVQVRIQTKTLKLYLKKQLHVHLNFQMKHILAKKLKRDKTKMFCVHAGGLHP